MFAGYAPRFAPLVEYVERNMVGGSLDDAIAAFEAAYRVELLKRIESEVLLNFGWTREEFFQHGRERLGEFRFSTMVDAIAEMDLDIELLVIGYDAQSRAHMFAVSTYGIVTRIDQLGYHAIGVGAQAAMGALYPLGSFERDPCLENILYRTLAAKFTAESVPGVGKETFVLWRELDATGIIRSTQVEALRQLWKDEGQPPIPARAAKLMLAPGNPLSSLSSLDREAAAES